MGIAELTGDQRLRVGTGGVDVEIVSEPEVAVTRRGYAPILRVRVLRSGLPHYLFISPISLTEQLERIRAARGRLAGTRIKLSKKSEDQYSPYVLEILGD